MWVSFMEHEVWYCLFFILFCAVDS